MAKTSVKFNTDTDFDNRGKSTTNGRLLTGREHLYTMDQKHANRLAIIEHAKNSNIVKPTRMSGFSPARIDLIKKINTDLGPAVSDQKVMDAISKFGSSVYYVITPGADNDCVHKKKLDELINCPGWLIIGWIDGK